MLEQQRESDLQKHAKDSALVSTRRPARVVADREEPSLEEATAETVRPRLPSPIPVDDDSGSDELPSSPPAPRRNDTGNRQCPMDMSIELSPPTYVFQQMCNVQLI